MKIKVDEELCIGCGACQAICPASFKVENGKSKFVENSDCAKQAADSCPEGAITVEE